MVGMTRAHIADPYFVWKLMSNKEDDIKPYVGASYCIHRIYVGNEALCIHNAATGLLNNLFVDLGLLNNLFDFVMTFRKRRNITTWWKYWTNKRW